MRKLILFLAFAIAAALAVPSGPANAQRLEVSSFATSPQKGETDIAARSFGYGFAGHAVFPIDDAFGIVGTIQYHNHDRAIVQAYGVDIVEGDSDFWAGAGLRVQKWNVYVQGIGGFVQKRDALDETENDTIPAAFVGWGFQPGVVGVSGGWYFSDFGTQYGAGLTLRF